MIGKTLGRYRVTAKLGEGGMGSVWRAEDTILDRPVALKLLAPHLAASEESRQRFIREARNASRLEHPGIATVYDAGEADGQVFIAYQLIEGETLEARLAAGPLPLPELLRVAVGSSEALAHAHGRDVLHRDLTASNIMLRPDGAPVIVDFGLARAHGDVTLTRTGTTLGTAPYLAPEQWRGERGDARTDLWSLGVVLYYAATAQQPFGKEPPEAVMYRVLNEDPVKPTKLRAELPPGFERLVLRLLEKDARDRPTSAAELAAALGAVASAEAAALAAPDPGESMPARARRWWRRQTRRRFGPAQVVVMLAVMAVLATAAWLVRMRIEAARERVLAVMPLRNTSRDSVETAYLGEGFGQELVRRLGAAGGFRILPWTTSAGLPHRDTAPQAIAHALRADVLLLGSFSGEGERLQVLVELVDGRSGLQIWSERYVRVISDLIQLQTELATAVAEHMARKDDRERPGRIAQTAPANADAYDHYLRGAGYLQSADEAQKTLAEPMFRRAVELDPGLAVAWVGLGAVMVDRYYSRASAGAHDLAEADSSFRRALELDPDLPAAARGVISLASEYNSTNTCLELAGNALKHHAGRTDALITAGWGFTLGGLPELAVRTLDRALEADANDAGADWYRVIALNWSAQDRRCIEAGRSHVRRFGEDAEMYLTMGNSSAALGNLRDAQTYLERSVELGQPPLPPPVGLAVLYQATGQSARSMLLLDTTITKYRGMLGVSPDNLRLRSVLACLLALKRDTPAWDAEVSAILSEVRRGNLASGGSEPDLALAAAASGDLGGARRLARDFRGQDDWLTAWWLAGTLAERGAAYVCGEVPAFLRSEEYRGIRQQAAALHSRRLSAYRPIVEKALRR